MFRGAWVPQGNPRTSPVAGEPALAVDRGTACSAGWPDPGAQRGLLKGGWRGCHGRRRGTGWGETLALEARTPFLPAA